MSFADDTREIQRIKNLVHFRDVVCTECGMTNERHLSKWGRSLHVHRVRAFIDKRTKRKIRAIRSVILTDVDGKRYPTIDVGKTEWVDDVGAGLRY